MTKHCLPCVGSGKSSSVLDRNAGNCEPTGLEFIPVEGNFGTIIIGESNNTVQPITVHNTGKSTVQILGVAITAGHQSFELTGENFPEFLAGGASFDIGVAVVPGQESGNIYGILEVETNEDRASYAVALSARVLESGALNGILQQAYDYFNAKLTEESWARANADEAEAGHRLTLEANMGDLISAKVLEEQIARVTADTAEASTRTELIANVRNEYKADLEEERIARANGDSAEATARLALGVQILDTVDAKILVEHTAMVNSVAAEASRVDDLFANFEVAGIDQKIQAAIESEALARATAISAEATARETLAATLRTESAANIAAGVQTERDARITQYGALSSRVDTIVANYITDADANSIAEAIASAKVAEEAAARATAIETVADKVSVIEANYTNPATVNSIATTIANAKVAAEASARTNADQAIADRVSSIEGTYVKTPDMNTAIQNVVTAKVAEEAAIRLAADNAQANRTTSLEVSSASSGNGVALNPNFARWVDALPTGWYTWGNLNFNKEPVSAVRGSPYAVNTVTLNNSESSGIHQSIWMTPGKWILEVTASLESYDMNGAGVTLSGIANIDFLREADSNNAIGAVRGVRSWSKLIDWNMSGQTNLHAMANWEGFAGASNLSVKTIRWFYLNVRPASSEEIKAGKALADVATAFARITTEEQTRLAQDNILAQRSSALEASQINSSTGNAQNPNFARYSGNSVPDGWQGWYVEENPGTIQKIGTDLVRGSRTAMRAVIQNTGRNVGISQPVYMTPGKWILEVTANLVSGNMFGSGVTLGGVSHIDFNAEPDNNNVTGGNTSVRSWSKLIDWTYTGNVNLHAMANWNGFTNGNDAALPTKDIVFYYLNVRPANSEEIKAGRALADAATANARVSNEETARIQGDNALGSRIDSVSATAGSAYSNASAALSASADAQNKLSSARVEFIALTSGGRARMTLRSDTNGGAGIDLEGDVRIYGNLVVDGTITTPKVQDGAISNTVYGAFGNVTSQAGNYGSGNQVSFISDAIYVNTTGKAVRVDAIFEILVNTSGPVNSYCTFTLIRSGESTGGAAAVSSSFVMAGNSNIPMNVWGIDVPPGGTAVYRIGALINYNGSSNATYTIKNLRLTATELKK